MRVVVQRVINSSVEVDNKIVGKYDKVLMLLVGFTEGDSSKEIDWMVDKVINLRIFEDEFGKMNKSLLDVNGSILAISQFTLYADCKHGNRPSFTEAMKFDKASQYYDLFCERLRELGFDVKKGIFGADMKIELLNDGPVTILLDSDQL